MILEIARGVKIISVIPKNLMQKLYMMEGKEAYFTIDAADVIIALD